MSSPLTYRDAIAGLRELGRSHHPAHVRITALLALVREVSPSNPHHEAIERALKPEVSPNPTYPEKPPTRAERKRFHLNPLGLVDPLAHIYDPPPEEEEDPEEEDDPL